MSADSSIQSDKIRNGMHKRDQQVYGADYLKSIQSACVLISGINGVGVEVAKNLVLAGVSVILHDTENVSISDIGSNCFLREEHLGQNRAEATVPGLLTLKELDLRLTITADHNPLTADSPTFKSTTHVILTSGKDAKAINQLCRNQGKGFVLCESIGLFSRTFVDVGKEYVTLRPNTIHQKSEAIVHISNSNPATVTVTRYNKHQLSFVTGEYVSFKNVEGMEEINNCAPARITCPDFGADRVTFTVDIDTTHFKPYKQGGTAITIPQPLEIKTHRPFAEQEISAPAIVQTEYSTEYARSETVHSCFYALDKIRKEHPDWNLSEKKTDFLNLAHDSFEDIFAGPARKQRQAMIDEAVRKAAEEAEARKKAAEETRKRILEQRAQGVNSKFLSLLNDDGILDITDEFDEYDDDEPEPTSSNSTADPTIPPCARDLPLPVIPQYEVLIAILFYHSIGGELPFVNSVIAGIGAQEIMKQVVQQQIPIEQFLYMTFPLHFLPGDTSPSKPYMDVAQFEASLPSPEETAPLNTRYDAQIKVLGRTLLQKISETSLFLVGAGATGCEFLKLFAQDGFACHLPTPFDSTHTGLLTVTDMDSVELSNLSRQFLFRQADIGHPKSERAVAKVLQINPALNVKAHTLPVNKSPESEAVFNSAFWDSLTVAVTAVDNADARSMISRICLDRKLAMLNCGTHGIRAKSQLYVPYISNPYHDENQESSKRQITESCTLKTNPFLIEHTVDFIWVEFCDLFNTLPSMLDALLRSFSLFLIQQLGFSESDCSRIQSKDDLVALLKEDPPPDSMVEQLAFEASKLIYALSSLPHSIEDCLRWARHLFDAYFVFRIQKQLLLHPPESHDETGKRYWTEQRRLPHEIPFDVNNPQHFAFVQAAAALLAHTIDKNCEAILYSQENIPAVKEMLQKIEPLDEEDYYKYFDNPGDGDNPSMMDDNQESLISVITDLYELHSKIAQDSKQWTFKRSLNTTEEETAPLKFTPFPFEKDSDLHMAFVFNGANLRAENYSIGAGTELEIAQRAGNIIPAVATTTSLASALACADLVAYIGGARERAFLRSWDVEQGHNTYYRAIPHEVHRYNVEMTVEQKAEAEKAQEENEAAAKLLLEKGCIRSVRSRPPNTPPNVWDTPQVLYFDHVPNIREVVERTERLDACPVKFILHNGAHLYKTTSTQFDQHGNLIPLTPEDLENRRAQAAKHMATEYAEKDNTHCCRFTCGRQSPDQSFASRPVIVFFL